MSSTDPINGYLSSFSPLQAQALLNTITPSYEVDAVAAGVDQATAYVMTKQATHFTTVNAGEGAVLPFIKGQLYAINSGANDLLVYPPVGYSILGNVVDAPVTVPVSSKIAGFWGNSNDGQDYTVFYTL